MKKPIKKQTRVTKYTFEPEYFLEKLDIKEKGQLYLTIKLLKDNPKDDLKEVILVEITEGGEIK